MPEPTAVDRMMRFATKSVHREWAGHQTKLGERLERALLAEAVLEVLAQQSEEVSDAKVRELLTEGWLQIMGV